MNDEEVIQYLYQRLSTVFSSGGRNFPKDVDNFKGLKIDRQPLPGHQVTKLKETNNKAALKLDMKQFQNVLRVDTSNRVMIVEAGCNMEKLFEAADNHSLIPKVLPELKSITVGGAIVGSGLESSSFKYGQFNDICRKVYVLLETNEIIACSATQHADLYHSLSGSYGTLGSVLCAEIECIESTSHVLVTVNGFENSVEGLQFMEERIFANQLQPSNTSTTSTTTTSKPSSTIEFIEGIQYPPQEGNNKQRKMAVMTSEFIHYSPAYSHIPIFHAEASHEEFYYEKIEHMIDTQLAFRSSSSSSSSSLQKQSVGRQLVIPLREFLFRYDHGAFWMAKPIRFSWSLMLSNPLLLFPFFLVANQWICRQLFRSLFTTKILYACLHYAHQQVVAQKMVLMDVYVPWKSAIKLIDYVHQDIPITTPMWICPVLRPTTTLQPFSPHGVSSSQLMVDIGIYGRVPDNRAWQYTRQLDLWAIQNQARKMLYSQQTYTEEEFWDRASTVQIDATPLNAAYYRKIRSQYQIADTTPSIFDKVVAPMNKEQQNAGFSWVDLIQWIVTYLLL